MQNEAAAAWYLHLQPGNATGVLETTKYSYSYSYMVQDLASTAHGEQPTLPATSHIA